MRSSADTVERTSATITIAAGCEEVMAVIADLEGYPEWASAVKAVDVLSSTEDGWCEQVRMKLDAGLAADTMVLNYQWQIESDYTGRVAWNLESAGMVNRLDGTYTVRKVTEERTEVTYEIAVQPKVPVLGLLRRKAEKMLIDIALGELQRHLEH